jgi:hypothetical protein
MDDTIKFLYILQRTLGDLRALNRGGPARLGARLARRAGRRAVLGYANRRWHL